MSKRVRTSKSIEWTRVMSERLCEAYQAEEILYTVQHELYHNREARTAAWKRIALQLGVSAEDARSRMDNMRTQYLRFKKIQPNENGYVSSTHWLVGKLHFLDDYLKSRSGVAIVSDQYDHSGAMNVVLDGELFEGELTSSDSAQQWGEYSNNQSVEDSDETLSQALPDHSVLPSSRTLYTTSRLVGGNLSADMSTTVHSSRSAPFCMTDPAADVRSSLDMLNNAVIRMTNDARLWHPPSQTQDVHDAFATYIAFELRQGACNPQALTACKREIFMSIARLQDTCNSRLQAAVVNGREYPPPPPLAQSGTQLKTEQ